MRRRAAQKRKRMPDPIYNSNLVSKMIGFVMLDGKRSVAERIVYGAIDSLKEKTNAPDALECFEKAIDNVKPVLEVKSRRVGGATYQVPMEVRAERRITLALRWIIRFAKDKKGRPMKEKLAQELFDAYNMTGSAVKKKEDTHKMAEANKAFAHYRW